jgi:hypothetical protein
MPSRTFTLALKKTLARKELIRHARWCALCADIRDTKAKEPEAIAMAREIAERIAPQSAEMRRFLVHLLTPYIISDLRNPRTFPPLSSSKGAPRRDLG